MLGRLGGLFDSNSREVKRLQTLVQEVNAFEPTIQKLTDDELKAKSDVFKKRYQAGESLDELMFEAFACAREAARRTIGERPFDVQVMAAIVLHQGKIAEQKTGEGKTLSATMPLYLNALSGSGVHLVAPNDYLTRRDAEWMGNIYHALGLSVAAIPAVGESYLYVPKERALTSAECRGENLVPIERREAYLADITYGTNNELGFDYLRDNMVWDFKERVQKEHVYAIVDEVDSILIDEARTPLIISAPAEESTDKYYRFSKLVQALVSETDFVSEEKGRTVALTEKGIAGIEKTLGVENLYEKDFDTVHHIEEALRARIHYLIDRDYVVKDGQVIIVDQFTGRLMPGRRYSEGLHQAIEAKENVEIQRESQTLATISFQNYFRLYKKLAGMTGTAETEAEEFHKIYNLDVVVVPTHLPMVRKDHSDFVYKSRQAKYLAVADDVSKRQELGQPVLVGTTSIEQNEILSALLKQQGVRHEVLNAKNHAREAEIIAKAGQNSAVTIATNMAGRGTDIKLGEGVKDLGGLHVIGTERHESRRIDNQLRGRSGRQGDPGSSRFYVSLEDDLMRIFGGDRVKGLMETLKLPDDLPIENIMVSKLIESSQGKVEGYNFDIRKHLVEYDDVMNKQREVVYSLREKILRLSDQNVQVDLQAEKSLDSAVEDSVKSMILKRMREQVENLVMATQMDEEVMASKLSEQFVAMIPVGDASKIQKQLEQSTLEQDSWGDYLFDLAEKAYAAKETALGLPNMMRLERMVFLSSIDNLWMEYLDTIDDVREGIGLRGYGQRDPLVEYKNEAYRLFEQLVQNINYEVVRRVYRMTLVENPSPARPIIEQGASENVGAVATGFTQAGALQSTAQKADASRQSHTPIRSEQKIGRNDPCWCGSGKKYKKCHLNKSAQTPQEREAYRQFQQGR